MGPLPSAERRRATTPRPRVDALLGRRAERADAFAAAYAGKVASLDGAGLDRRDAASSARSRRSPAAPAPTRTCRSRSTPPTPPTARCCSASRRRAPRSRPRCCSSTSSGRRWTTRRAEELLATDGLDFARHHLATARRYRPHLLSEPEEKILTEKAVSGRSAWVRLFEEQTAAITVELPDERRAGRRWRSRWRGSSTPDREVRRDDRRARHRRAAARPAHARVHVQHAARGQDDRRPAARATRTGWRRATSPTRPPTSPCRR